MSYSHVRYGNHVRISHDERPANEVFIRIELNRKFRRTTDPLFHAAAVKILEALQSKGPELPPPGSVPSRRPPHDS